MCLRKPPKKYDIEKLIREYYLNISDPLYTRSPILMEINFLRIALLLSTLRRFDFPPSINSCISQILNKTKNASDHIMINSIIADLDKGIILPKCSHFISHGKPEK